MDDIGSSRENEARCKKVTSEIDTILTTGQFQVKTWQSNNKNVNQSDEECTDFLDHKWNTVPDKISFKSEIEADLRNLSKTGCLASIAQMWDCMGLVSQCTIELRIDLQELWSAGYSLDKIRPKEIHMKWIRTFIHTHIRDYNCSLKYCVLGKRRMFVECSTKFAFETCCIRNQHDNTSFGKRLPRGFGGGL